MNSLWATKVVHLTTDSSIWTSSSTSPHQFRVYDDQEKVQHLNTKMTFTILLLW